MAAANRPWSVVLNGLGQQNATQNRFEMQGKESEKTFGLNRINLGALVHKYLTVDSHCKPTPCCPSCIIAQSLSTTMPPKEELE